MQVKLLFISLFYFGSLLSVVYAQAQNHIHDEKAAKVDFSKPDDVRTFPLGKVDLAKIGGAMIGRAVFQPGWKWSESVKPIAKT